MIPRPESKRQIIREIHEHEIHLSFESDWHAAAFEDWFNSQGFETFAAWAAKNHEDYE